MKKNVYAISLVILSAICLMPLSALAHTGVGGTTGFGSGFGHPIGGADHLLAMLAVGLWAAQMAGRAIWAIPSAFVIVMILGGILGISGIPAPYVEEGILLSVLVLGILIATAFKFPLAISALIVGIFAVFHGHAHGTEMPLAIGGLSYSIGFSIATVLLHAFGIAIGVALQKLNIEKVVRFAGGAIAISGIYLALA
ncbi:MAG: hypothetical protein GQ578_08560 [Desulfuromonadaceae bacterium]|nr:hypothetical protein [Desulfuromonadaceae bacterium]